ncbi:hypothetical protein [[Mycoplasma] testudinis]|uniref:hypothetical protein n=1 Tax=[Mycoplasma] testudinis TaxID=33924 RepID=UPI000483B96B|nr:hypothetical protein [[Mycoplasma] testudinis]
MFKKTIQPNKNFNKEIIEQKINELNQRLLSLFQKQKAIQTDINLLTGQMNEINNHSNNARIGMVISRMFSSETPQQKIQNLNQQMQTTKNLISIIEEKLKTLKTELNS